MKKRMMISTAIFFGFFLLSGLIHSFFLSVGSGSPCDSPVDPFVGSACGTESPYYRKGSISGGVFSTALFPATLLYCTPTIQSVYALSGCRPYENTIGAAEISTFVPDEKKALSLTIDFFVLLLNAVYLFLIALICSMLWRKLSIPSMRKWRLPVFLSGFCAFTFLIFKNIVLWLIR